MGFNIVAECKQHDIDASQTIYSLKFFDYLVLFGS